MTHRAAALIEAAIPLTLGLLLFWKGNTLGKKPDAAETPDPALDAKRLARTRGLATLVVLFGVWNGYRAFASDESPRRTLEDIAAGVRAKLPVRVDDDLRFDDILVGDHELMYVYTLVRRQKSGVDADELRRSAEERLRELACKDPQVSKLLAAGALVSQRFRDKDGALVAEVGIPPSACGYEDSETVANRVMLLKALPALERGDLSKPSSR